MFGVINFSEDHKMFRYIVLSVGKSCSYFFLLCHRIQGAPMRGSPLLKNAIAYQIEYSMILLEGGKCLTIKTSLAYNYGYQCLECQRTAFLQQLKLL